jgi:hypothetical protein
LDTIEASIRSAHASELEELRREYEVLRTDFAERVEEWQKRVTDLHDQLKAELEAAKPDVKEFPAPQGGEAEEPPWVLYDSALDYESQLERYKSFQDGIDRTESTEQTES